MRNGQKIGILTEEEQTINRICQDWDQRLNAIPTLYSIMQGRCRFSCRLETTVTKTTTITPKLNKYQTQA